MAQAILIVGTDSVSRAGCYNISVPPVQTEISAYENIYSSFAGVCYDAGRFLTI